MFLTGSAFRGSVLRKLGLAAVVATCAVIGSGVQARSGEGPGSSIELSALPPEAQQTAKLIRSGGPFPYAKDGTVFGNRERLLPPKPRGHYREYTVKTPGSRDRGARRIICGGAKPAEPEACYYTADHYTSFSRIVQ